MLYINGGVPTFPSVLVFSRFCRAFVDFSCPASFVFGGPLRRFWHFNSPSLGTKNDWTWLCLAIASLVYFFFFPLPISADVGPFSSSFTAGRPTVL